MNIVLDKSIVGTIKDFLKGKKLLFSMRVKDTTALCQIYDSYLVQWETSIVSMSDVEVGSELSFNLLPIMTLFSEDEDLTIDVIAGTITLSQSNLRAFSTSEFERVVDIGHIDDGLFKMFSNARMKYVMRIFRVASAIAKEQSTSTQPPIFCSGRYMIKYNALAYFTPFDFDDCSMSGEILNLTVQHMGSGKVKYIIDGDRMIMKSSKYTFIIGIDKNSTIFMEYDSIKAIEEKVSKVCSVDLNSIRENTNKMSRIIKKQLVNIGIHHKAISIGAEVDGIRITLNPQHEIPIIQFDISIAQLQVLVGVFDGEDSIDVYVSGRYIMFKCKDDSLILPVLIS